MKYIYMYNYIFILVFFRIFGQFCYQVGFYIQSIFEIFWLSILDCSIHSVSKANDTMTLDQQVILTALLLELL